MPLRETNATFAPPASAITKGCSAWGPQSLLLSSRPSLKQVIEHFVKCWPMRARSKREKMAICVDSITKKLHKYREPTAYAYLKVTSQYVQARRASGKPAGCAIGAASNADGTSSSARTEGAPQQPDIPSHAPGRHEPTSRARSLCLMGRRDDTSQTRNRIVRSRKC